MEKILFNKVDFNQIKQNDYVMLLAKNIYNVQTIRGMDFVLEKKDDSYTYNPIEDQTKVFNLLHEQKYTYFVVKNGNKKICSLLKKQINQELGILPEYSSVFADIFSLDITSAHELVYQQLTEPVSFVNFMMLYLKHSKIVNEFYYDINKENNSTIIKSSFGYIFEPSFV